MSELISIIIPIYNCSEYIKEALVSCIRQTYENIEIVCIDDGSTDNSSIIAETILAKSGRKNVILHKNNGGVASARNIGIQAASGKFVSFLDGDDILSSGAITVLMKAITFEKASAVVGDYIYSEDFFNFDETDNPLINGCVDLMSRPFIWGGYTARKFYQSLTRCLKEMKTLSS